MTVAVLSGSVAFPHPFYQSLAGTVSVTSYLLDQIGEMAGFVFQVPKTGSITKVGMRTAAVTQSDTNGYTVGLYNLDAAGKPDTASAYGGSAPATAQAVTANTSHTFTLATAATTATAGNIVAAVIQPTSYSNGNINIASYGGSGSSAHSFPYPVTNIGGTGWTARVQAPIGWVEYSDGSYAFIQDLLPGIVANETIATSGATNTELSLYFSLPVPRRLSGMGGIFGRAAGTTYSLILYDSSDSVLATMASGLDTDIAALATVVAHNVPFVTPYSMTANTQYHLAIKPVGATQLTMGVLTVPSEAAMDQIGGGQSMYYRSKPTAGAWGSTTTKRPLMWLWFDAFDDGAGGGGGMPASRIFTGM